MKYDVAPDHVVALARAWIGTPYRHQASVRQVGADCLGLVRGVYRDLYGREPCRVPAYSRDWAECLQSEPLLEAAAKYLEARATKVIRPGDVLVFRPLRHGAVKHAAIASDEGRMIHAQEGCCVAEVALSQWWRRRLVASFQFPGVA